MSSECPNTVITRNLDNQGKMRRLLFFTIPHIGLFLSKSRFRIHITGVVQHTRQPGQNVLDLNNHFERKQYQAEIRHTNQQGLGFSKRSDIVLNDHQF
jgi:hypothetical protein